MKVELLDHICIVTKEPGDPRFSGVVNAAGESRLLYHVKKILNEKGYNLIKKRMHKDGHLVSDMQQYLRTKKPSDDGNKDIYIYNSNWNVEGAEEVLNRDGKVVLTVERNVFNKEKEIDPLKDRHYSCSFCTAKYPLDADLPSVRGTDKACRSCGHPVALAGPLT